MSEPQSAAEDAQRALGDADQILLDAGYTPAQIKLLQAAVVGDHGALLTPAVRSQHLRALRPASFKRHDSRTFH